MSAKKTDGSQKPPRKHVATGRPRGRPPKLTPDVQAAVVRLVLLGVPKSRCGPLVGVAVQTLHEWLQRGRFEEVGIYRDFADALMAAEAQLLQRAVSAVTDLLDPNAPGVEPGTRLNAAKFILSHRFREDFTTRTETELTGKDGGPVQVDATVRPLFSDAQLASLSPEQIAATVRGLVSGSGGE